MNSPTASQRPFQLRPDRFGSAFVHQQADHNLDVGKAARREPDERARFRREWIVAMAAAFILVTLAIAAKLAWFFWMYPGATGQ